MRIVAVGASLLAIGLAGCATLDRGVSDKLYVVSDPPGANASLPSGTTCTTPCSLDVGRRDEVVVTITKAGFAPQSIAIKTRLTGVGVGDLMEDVGTAGIGMIVDGASGAALEHVPNPVDVVLRPILPTPNKKRPPVS